MFLIVLSQLCSFCAGFVDFFLSFSCDYPLFCFGFEAVYFIFVSCFKFCGLLFSM